MIRLRSAVGIMGAGFLDRTSSTLAFDAENRTLTVTPSGGPYRFYVGGALHTHAAARSRVWPDEEGLHFCYFDGAGDLTSTTDADTIAGVIAGAGAPVAALYWDATAKALLRQIDERHGVELPCATHAYLHRYLGAMYESGGGLGDFSLVGGNPSTAAAAQFSCGDTVIADEDLRVTIADDAPQVLAPALYAPVFYLAGSGIWRRKTANAYPIIYSGTAGYTGANGLVPYNRLNGGTWSLAEVTSGNFVLVHIYATTDLLEPIIAVQGQAEYATAGAARAAARTEINSVLGLGSLLSTERRALGTVIFQTMTGASNVPRCKVVATDAGGNYVDWRSTLFFANTAQGEGIA